MSTDEARTWADFYRQLHQRAERARAKKALEGVSPPSSANSTVALTDNRPADSTPAPGQPQTKAHR